MHLIICETAVDTVAEWSAKYIVKRINEFKPSKNRCFVLGLSTGNISLSMYKKLIDFYKTGKFSFKYVITFNMSEYVNLPMDHSESHHNYMFNNFFKYIDINPENVHILDGNASNLVEECDDFERKIKEVGGIDLFIADIDTDGNIAFNGLGSSLVSRTRVKTLAHDTLEANARFFGNDINKVPKQALTVGVGTVMDAKEVLLLITGPRRAHALYKAVEKGINHTCKISVFQQHPRALIICDEDAIAELRVKTVKYFKGLHLNHKLIGENSKCPLCNQAIPVNTQTEQVRNVENVQNIENEMTTQEIFII